MEENTECEILKGEVIERGGYLKGELAQRRTERYQDWIAEMECEKSVKNTYRIPKPFVGVFLGTLNQLMLLLVSKPSNGCPSPSE